MTNFSSFFPAAGGGGFTKMKKISTFNSTDETTDKSLPNIGLKAQTNNLQASLTTSVYYENNQGFDFTAQDAFVGYTYTSTSGSNTYVHTITASGSNGGTYDPFSITMSRVPAGSNIAFNWWAADPAKTMIAPPITINPANDLGLSDGDSIGYMLVGGNCQGILQGTATISDASTDLECAPGLSDGSAATITGGLTLTSADGNTDASHERARGSFSAGVTVGYGAGGGSGINGYGVGSQWASSFKEGFGGSGRDGAILLFY